MLHKRQGDSQSVKSSDNSLNSRDSKGRKRTRRSPYKQPIDESLLEIADDMKSDFAFSQIDESAKPPREGDLESDDDTDVGDDSYDEFMRVPRRQFGIYGSKVTSE